MTAPSGPQPGQTAIWVGFNILADEDDFKAFKALQDANGVVRPFASDPPNLTFQQAAIIGRKIAQAYRTIPVTNPGWVADIHSNPTFTLCSPEAGQRAWETGRPVEPTLDGVYVDGEFQSAWLVLYVPTVFRGLPCTPN